MIITIDRTNILKAAEIHSVSWQESHRSFYSIPAGENVQNKGRTIY